MEKGVILGISNRNGDGVGFLYNPIQASGVRFEKSGTPMRPMRACKAKMIMAPAGGKLR
jgi:hypothetical protein